MTYYVQLALNGVIAGSIYALFAVGLTMVYGIFRFINFAHGELIALGAYLTLLFTQNIFSLPLYYAVLPALIVTISIGLAQERYIYRPLRHGNRISLLIASIGLSYLLRNGIRIVWGSDLMTYGLKPSRGMEFAGLIITQVQILMMAAAVLFLGRLYFLFTRTMLGKSLRAVADNMELADIMGINMNRVSMTVWTLASVFAGVGGILLALDTNLEPLMGLTNMIKAFAAMLLGGSGNVWGALLGGLFIEIFENVGVAFFHQVIRTLYPFPLSSWYCLFVQRAFLGS